MDYLTGNVIYFEGTCENPSTEGALCTPTTTNKKQKTDPKKEKTEPDTPDIGKPFPKTEPKEKGEERENETEDNDDYDNNEYDNNTDSEDDANNVRVATGGNDEKFNQSLITIIAVVFLI